MKKITIILLALLVPAMLFAAKATVIMNDGTIKEGELIGQDEDAVYLKGPDGKAVTIPMNDVKKVFGAAAESKKAVELKTEKPVSKTKQADFKDEKQEPYKLLEKGVREMRPDLFKRTYPDYMMLEFDFINAEFLMLGDEFKSAYNVDAFVMNLGMNASIAYRPFDWFSAGIYIGADMPPIISGILNKNEYEIGHMSFMRAGFNFRIMPYTKGRGEWQEVFYIGADFGARKAIFESKIGGQPIDIDTFDMKIVLGFSPAIKIGYIFCPTTYTLGTSTVEHKIDLSGPFVSLSGLF